MTDHDSQHFAQFMKQRETVAQAYARGDAAPLGDIVTHASSASFFGPGGGHTEGAEAVWATHREGAKRFEPDGESRLEILDSGASGGIGYWVGIQRAKVRMTGTPQPQQMDLRVTEIFRREGDAWKLIHRHADMLVNAQAKPTSK